MSLMRLLNRWRTEPTIGSNISITHRYPQRSAKTFTFPDDLHPVLIQSLKYLGITDLYSHQYISWQELRAGNNLVITTGTASGKTLCYNLPVLAHLLDHPNSRALYIFPTKALAQDQKTGLKELLSAINIHKPEIKPPIIATYDGDTQKSSRKAIRDSANIIFTNPDMLHTAILPYHANWEDFFRNLRYFVIDEIHTYRGVFGSHVASVIRRMKRIARFYGSYPTFILTSATIANPSELAGQLIEEENIVLIDKDGSDQGEKYFLIYNPPIVNKELGIRRSALQESIRLAEDLFLYDVQTIIFGRSRRTVELILKYLRQNLSSTTQLTDESSNIKELIRGYRGGYMPHQRREVERGLRKKKIRTVIATNALELGMDIGGLESALLVGFPGSIAATWQQAGRAGRGDQAALAVLIVTSDPLDQYLAHHIEYFFSRSPEQALINPDNLLILLDHLRCAAFELPFQTDEAFGSVNHNAVAELLEVLVRQGYLHHSGEKFFWMSDQYPAQLLSLRSTAGSKIILQSDQDINTITIGEIDSASARWMVHPGAIYLHEADSYLVDELDLENQIAILKKIDTDWYTEPILETTVSLIEKYTEQQTHGAVKVLGEIEVDVQLTGYRKLKWFTNEKLDQTELKLPPTQLLTTGYWFELKKETIESLRENKLWSNDPNEYGPNWRTHRDRARERDGYRCQICGIPEKNRSHDVHHIKPLRAYVYELTAQHGINESTLYDLANRLENLITLCPNCHKRAESSVRIRSGLAGLGYVLGHLAPLSVMCTSTDLGIHTDPASPLAEGNPIVMIYDRIPAGIGLSNRLFEIHWELIHRSQELVSTCKCQHGCPSCVGPGGEYGFGSKTETLALLSKLAS